MSSLLSIWTTIYLTSFPLVGRCYPSRKRLVHWGSRHLVQRPHSVTLQSAPLPELSPLPLFGSMINHVQICLEWLSVQHSLSGSLQSSEGQHVLVFLFVHEWQNVSNPKKERGRCDGPPVRCLKLFQQNIRTLLIESMPSYCRADQVVSQSHILNLLMMVAMALLVSCCIVLF